MELDQNVNKSLRAAIIAITVVFALSGINHGVFEILQGNTRPEGAFISAIGPEQRMWIHGEEGALTIVPNFLATGILAVTTSIVLVFWAIYGLHRKGGAHVLLGIFVLLLLFGGGVAQTPFFLVLYGFATRVNKPITWWREQVRDENGALKGGWLARLWKPLTGAFVVLMLFALQGATTGFVPGVSNPDTALMIVLACVGFCLLISPVIYSSALADDARQA